MDTVITIEPRAPNGKTATRKLRASGRVPAVIYGHKQKNQHVSVDPRVVERIVERSGYGRNTLFQLEGGDRPMMAMLREAQVDRFRKRVLHLDFIEIHESDEIRVHIPYTTVGKPAGVTAGGVLQSVVDVIELACKPNAIPRSLEINVEHLQIGQSVTFGELNAPPGTRVVANPRLPVIGVYAPRAAEEVATTAAAAVPVEGAAAAAAPAVAEEKKAPEKKEKK
ncbi:MAG: 50S ribosomal protein L25 [Deltaproteobacteria bacterium]|nr:50S ribosomal protein L25 [Deltaproteobacteria bacterium]